MKNKTFQDKLIQSLYEFRDNLAVKYGGTFITYSELDKRSNSIANWIIARGLKKETLLGILVQDRVNLISLIIGVLKAGCIFIPLDTAYPKERLQLMINSTNIKFVFTDKSSYHELLGNDSNRTERSPVEFIFTEDLFFNEISFDMKQPDITWNPEDKIYIYFTSGTSGNPKPIIGKNKSLLHFIDWEIDTFGINEGFRFSQFTTPGFDAFLRDVFVPLCSGGMLCIPGTKNILLNPEALINWIEKSRVQVIHCVPSFFRLIADRPLKGNQFNSLRYILLSGEKINPSDLVNWYETFADRIQLVNLYGPTETTMIKTYYFINRSDVNRNRIPIGRPMKGVRVMVLNKNMDICKEGIVGHLYIRTPYRTAGYCNDPALNQKRFIQNPFNDNPDDLLYQTGDLGRLLSDGNLEILYRVDRQVKLRGIRIELEEIESILVKHPLVKEALALKKEMPTGDEFLVVYVTAPKTAADQMKKELFITQLKDHLTKKLPDYMVPARIVKIEQIPLTPNGKIDYKMLPDAFAVENEGAVPPANQVERKLAELWAESLAINQNKIGVTDNFFDLGGNSFSIISLLSRIHKEFNLVISVLEIFNNLSIEKQAKLIVVEGEAKGKEIHTGGETVKAAEKKEYYQLSSTQKRLYVLKDMDDQGTSYNIPMVLILEGNIDKTRLENTFRYLIQRHESLRTSFEMIEENPVQKIHQEVEFEINVFGQGSQPAARSSQHAAALISSFICPFDLSHAPLLRVGLIKKDRLKHILAIDMHHVVSDGVSINLLINEFISVYDGKRLPELRIQYSDFSEWQNSVAQKKVLNKQKEYWLKELAGEIPTLNIPTDVPRPKVQSFVGNSVNFQINGEEFGALNNLALNQGTTLYVVLLSLFNVLLSKISNQEDIIIGTPIAGRKHAGLQQIIGVFVNTLALRNYPHGDKGFIDFLDCVKENTINAFDNQDYPFEELVEQLSLDRDVSRNPLFDVMFVLQNFFHVPGKGDASGQRIKDLQVKPYSYERKTSKFDLTLYAVEGNEILSFRCEYCTRLWREHTVLRFIKYYQQIISSVLRNPGCRISDIEVIPEKEKRQLLYEFNGTSVEYPKHQLIHHVFEEQVQRISDNIAVVGARQIEGNKRLAPLSVNVLGAMITHITYREVNKQSNQLAGLLRKKGVKPDTIVGIMTERSVEMIIGILGILKAGAAYLPIAPGYPEERIKFMLADSNAPVLLTTRIDTAVKKLNFNKEVVYLEKNWLNHGPQIAQGSVPTLSPMDHRELTPATYLAYVIYTSGTTGKPKGTMIRHYSLINRLNWMQKKYPLSTNDVILQKTPFTFDVSVWELFWWATAGGRICFLVPGGEKNPEVIIKAIEINNITVIHFVPSMLNAFTDYVKTLKEIKRLSSLKHLFASGEALTLQQVKTFNQLFYKQNNTRLANLYGPTEATIDVSYFDCSPGEDLEKIPIGKPIDNICLFILDKYHQVQPIGIPGELYISGDGLARGYLNRPGLTAEKFIPVSNKSYMTYMSHIIYKTGDLAKWLEDGNIEFLGRIDAQVKIRGFRIELGEIEEKLGSYKGVKEAVVTIRENQTGDQFLCAYIVTAEGYTSENTSLEKKLREYLSQYLPDYMIPTYFVNMEKIPLTPNGKVDRKALPGLKEINTQNKVGYIPPLNALEKKLADVWQQVLARTVIDVNQNFFAMGGDSIKLIQIISRMSAAGYKIEMRDFFQSPTISGLAARMKKTGRMPDQSIVTGEVPLTSIQEKFFTDSQIDTHHFNQAVMLYSKDGFDEKVMTAVFKRLQQHHDALRMTFKRKSENGKIIQTNHGLDYPLSLQIYDLKNLENSEQVLETKVNEIQAGICLETGPLMKLGLFHMKDGDRFLIVIHHLVIDAVSWRILLEDMENLIRQYKTGESLVLPSKTDSFKVWAEQLSKYANSTTLLKEKTYWSGLESAVIPKIMTDFAPTDNHVKDTTSCSFELREEETTLLLTEVNKAFGTEINDILLTALGLAINETFGVNLLLIALEGHGREEILEDTDISRTLGWFTTIYPTLLDFSYAHDLGRQVKEIKEGLRKIPNKGIGYGILKYLTTEANKKEIDFKLNPQIIFNYLGQFDTNEGQRSFEITTRLTGNSQSRKRQKQYEFDVGGIITNHQLSMTVAYNKKHYQSKTIETLVAHFQSQLCRLITFCSSIREKELTPSDFTYKGLSIEAMDQLSKTYSPEDIYTLSPMQEGMLFHALYDGSSSAYFQQLSYRLTGKLDIAAARKSIDVLFKRHDILRTVFVHRGLERPIQIVLKHQPIDIYQENINQEIGWEDKDALIKNFKQKDRQRAFNLSEDLLMRISVLKIDTSQYEVIWSFHHILLDGWCIGILNAEFFEIYTSFLENRPFHLPPVKPYRIYIQWLEKTDKELSKKYWQQYLDAYETAAHIPKTTAHIRENNIEKSEANQYKKEQVILNFDNEKTNRLNQTAGKYHVTINIILQTVWGIILSRYNNQKDVVFGAVVSGRPYEIEGVESMVGLFINTIPIRIRYNQKTTSKELLQWLQEQAVASEPHHYYPLAEIQSGIAHQQDLIDHIFIFENYPVAEEIEGYQDKNSKNHHSASLTISNVDLFEHTNYNFNVISGIREHLWIRFEYNRNVYSSDFIEKIALQFNHVFTQIIENDELEIKKITLLTQQEKKRILYDFNGQKAVLPEARSVYHLFSEQVEKTPDHVALIGKNSKSEIQEGTSGLAPLFDLASITFRELNERSDQLASLLREKGVEPDSIIGIMMEPSVQMIIGIMAILSTESAYLPISPDCPGSRIAYMLSDSGAKILLTTSMLAEETGKLTKIEVEKIFICTSSLYSRLAARPHPSPPSPANLAYVIYTSGSSGSPKGVMVENINVINLVLGLQQRIYRKYSKGLNIALVAPYVFDASVKQIFAALLLGHHLYIVPENVKSDGKRLVDYYKKYHTDISDGTPTHLYMMSESLKKDVTAGTEIETGLKPPLHLKHLVIGGEKLSRKTVERFFACFDQQAPVITNVYGPTECCVDSSSYTISKTELGCRDMIPIGTPLPNQQVYILDKENQPQPIDIPGELCISGHNLARGYLNKPELTAEIFVLALSSLLLALRRTKAASREILRARSQELMPDPLTLRAKSQAPRARLYRTGDLARWLPDGNIDFLDRIDRQVKIRGFRIEPAEIETQLLNIDHIIEAVVVDKKDENGNTCICAYIVTDKKIDLKETRNRLIQRLPDYMIPGYFTCLDEIPLTSNGKVDRKSLPEPGINRGEGETYFAPRNDIEEKLAVIWSEVLGIEQNMIGIDSHFFMLGGHSLKATIMTAKIHKEFNVDLPLAEIFKTPTIRELAKYIKGLTEDKYLSIEPAEKKEYYPLSSEQKRLYFLREMDDRGIGYNIPSVVILTGNLDKNLLEDIFRGLIKRHESLRTSFKMKEEGPLQIIHQADDVEFEIEYQDLKVTGAVDRREWEEVNPPETHHSSFITHHFIRPFDLSCAPLLRVGLVELQHTPTALRGRPSQEGKENKYLLMMDMHHIISDGTSTGILIREFMVLYRQDKEKLPLMKLQYKDYAEWKNSEIEREVIKKQEEYWLKTIAGNIPALNLPLDYIRPKVQSFEGSALILEIDKNKAALLEHMARDHGATLYMVLLSIYSVLLSKLSGCEDMIIGTPVAGRRHADLESIIGMFVNTLALKVYPRGDMPFEKFLEEVKGVALRAFQNQDYPFEDLVKKVGLSRHVNRNPLFDTMFFMQNIDMPEIEIPGLKLTPYDLPIKTSKFDLMLMGVEIEKKLLLTFEYSANLFKKSTIERFIGYYKKGVSVIIENPEVKISQIDIISDEEKQRIMVKFNDTEAEYPTSKVIYQLFEEQVEKIPHRIAGVGPVGRVDHPYSYNLQLTYKELNAKSNQLARLLRAKGVTVDAVVGIMLERSIDMIIAVLGIIKAGGGYLPIDPDYPRQRKQYMLADSDSKLLVTQKKYKEQMKGAAEILPIEQIIEYPRHKEYPDNPGPFNQQDDLIYVIYTSGSTGRPKGVMVEHRNVVRLVKNTNYIELKENERLLQTGALEFDASTFEIWGSLLNGLTLYIVPIDQILVSQLLKQMIRKYQVHTLWLTSPLFNQLTSEDAEIFAGLRNLLVGGDVLSPVHIKKVRKRFPGLNMINGYGPTENTTFSTTFLIKKEYQESIPIGSPIANSTAYIVDKSYYLQPIGAAGELWVGGVGVSRGYLNNPELTAEKFNHDLWYHQDYHDKNNQKLLRGALRKAQSIGRKAKNTIGAMRHAPCAMRLPPGRRRQKLYKTGDLARWMSDGNIEFLGRIDSQVKIRGFRIELGEIENQLLNHPAIKEAIIQEVSVESKDKYLCAYIVSIGENLPVLKFREYLGRKLPDYMIPSYFVYLEQIPLTPNGKIDHKALPAPGLKTGGKYAAPRNIIEKKLVEIWSETLLGSGYRSIGIDDNFFEWGGHSLKATILISRIHKELDVRIPLVELFKTPTIRGLARYIKVTARNKYAAVEPVEKKEYYQLSPAQKRLYILHQMVPDNTIYNMPEIIPMTENLHTPQLEETFRKLIAQHESLQTSFHMIDKEPVQIIHDQVEFVIEYYCAEHKTPGAGRKADRHATCTVNWASAARNFIRPFDLSHAPLLRVGLIYPHTPHLVHPSTAAPTTHQSENSDFRYLLMVDMHHIISDGLSHQILVRDFIALYRSDLLAPLKIQYKDFSEWQNNTSQLEAIKEQEIYWLKMFQGEIPVLNLPTDYARPITRSFEGSRLDLEISAEYTRALESIASKEGVTLYMVLLALMNILYSKLSSQEDIVIGSPTAGRRHADVENTIGMFVNTLAIRNYPKGEKSFKEFLSEVKERTLDAFENQEYPFEYLVEKLSVSRDPARNPLFDVMFSLQNFIEEEIDNSALIARRKDYDSSQHDQYPDENRMAKFDLTASGLKVDERLVFTFQYCRSLFKQETIERFIGCFKKLIVSIVKDPDLKLWQIEIIPEEEKEKILYNFNDTAKEYPKNKTIHQLFEEQVSRTPDSAAVLGTGYKDQEIESTTFEVRITFRKLNEQSNRWGGLLQKKGVKPGTIVGIMVNLSLETIIGILGILKAGGAYLPIAPDYPVERQRYMLEDSHANLLLTAMHTWSGSYQGEKIFPDIWDFPETNPSDLPAVLNKTYSPGNLAYCIYTSGSTGRPKGVMVEHSSAVNMLVCRKEEYKMGSYDISLQLFSYAFDGFVTSFFTPVISGSSVILLNEEAIKDINRIKKKIVKHKVTHFISIPALFQAVLNHLTPEELSSLKVVTLAGDKVSPYIIEIANRKNELLEIVNEYGITEGTVMSTLHRHQELDPIIKVGQPIWNTQLYILDNHNHLQPLGVPGELCIAGIGLSRGYLNQPELTAEKFDHDLWDYQDYHDKNNQKLLRGIQGAPWHGGLIRDGFVADDFFDNSTCTCNLHLSLLAEKSPPGRRSQKLYKTGDLARWMLDGNIEFLGRVDSQVKIRGFRIELGEIENQLLNHPAIKEAIIQEVSVESKDKYLCAYMVLTGENLAISELREHLGRKLPDYMIPSYFVYLEQIPLIPNGKIDRKALPAHAVKTGGEYAAPRNIIEKKLVEIWSEILLGRETLHASPSLSPISGAIGIDDNFFEWGGHSLKATVLISKIHKELDVRIPLVELFKTPTIRGLSRYIKVIARDKYSAIEPTERKEYYQLSSAQKRLYILQQMVPDSTVYNMLAVIPLTKTFDRIKLEETFALLLHRHESLRTSFFMMNEEPVQMIHHEVEFGIEDYKSGREGDFIRPFELSRAPSLRVGLIKAENQEYLLLVDIHHIISDGLSHEILVRDFMALYRDETLPRLRIQYKDFAQWQNNRVQSEAIKEQGVYWLKVFQGEPPVLDLAADYPRPTTRSFEGSSSDFEISVQYTRALESIASGQGVTLYMVLLALINILCSKLSRQEDIIIGSPAAGRRHVDLENIIGMFVNTLALRNYPRGEKPFKEFLQEIKERTLEAFENQEYPFEDLVEKVCVSRDPGRNPLFDVMFTLQNFLEDEVDTSGLTPQRDTYAGSQQEQYLYENRMAKFDLTITALKRAEKLLFTFQYCSRLFKPETIERFTLCIKKLVSSIVKNPDLKLWQLEFIPAEEKEQILYNFNDTTREYPKDKPIHQLFEEQVEITPDYIAVVGPNSEDRAHSEKECCALNYRELNRKSNQLARLIRKKGISPGGIAAIMVGPSIEMLIGILAVLKAGAAYLPIDPHYPRNRILYILKDSDSALLLTQTGLVVDAVQARTWEIIGLENKNLFQGVDRNLTPLNTAEDSAYIIYTSGSTGRPKGTLIQHHALNNLCGWHNKRFSITANDRAAKYAGFGFDASVWEIFPYLIAGASLYIINDDIKLDMHRLNRYFEKNQITLAFLPTQICEQFMTLFNTSLRILLTGGDKLKSYLKRDYQLVNNYGPTENTVVTTSFVVDDHYLNIPIGKPIDNTKLFVLNKYLQLQPVGVSGELYISGCGLSIGYLNQPELTAEKFVEQVTGASDRGKWKNNKKFLRGVQEGGFCKKSPLGRRRQKIYHTGDLTKWRSDGNLEFLGRIDQQVKIRGLRIELEEIQRQLINHEEIKEAVTLAKEDQWGEKYLCAYLISDQAIDISLLNDRLSGCLPGYMIPSYFIQIEEIPLTPNGKINRDALPNPEKTNGGSDAPHGAPRNTIERKLVKIWQHVLGKEHIGINDDFFLSGGDSIKAIQVAARMNNAGYKVDTMDIFQKLTISELASGVSRLERSENSHIDFSKEIPAEIMEQLQQQYDIEDIYPLTPMQEGMLFHSLAGKRSAVYFEQFSYRLQGKLEVPLVEKSLNRLFHRFDILRTLFIYRNIDRPYQVVLSERKTAIYFKDISHLTDKEQQQFIRQFKERDRNHPFDLSKDMLTRLAVIQSGVFQYEFIWSFHHILFDGWCMGILIPDFWEIYNSLRENREARLLPVNPYRTYIQWLERQDKEQSGKFWHKYMENFEKATHMAALSTVGVKTADREIDEGYKREAFSFTLDREKTAVLNGLAGGNRVTVNTVMQALWGILLARYTGSHDVLFGTVVSGRPAEIQGVETMVGLFINTIPVRIRLQNRTLTYKKGDTFKELIQGIQEDALACEPYHYYPLARIQAESVLKQDLLDHLLIFENFPVSEQIERANLMQRKEQDSESLRLSISPSESFGQTNYDFNIIIYHTAILEITFLYNGNIYEEGFVERTAGHFRMLIQQVLTDEHININQLDMLGEKEKNHLIKMIKDEEDKLFIKNLEKNTGFVENLEADFDF